MAIFAFTDANVTINAVNESATIKSVKFNYSAADLKTTAFGATAEARIGGLKDGTVSVKFNQDMVAAGTDAKMWALLGTVVAFKVKATSAANSTSNPEYQFNVLVTEWSPFGGAVGDLAEVEVSWPITGAVTRATT